ncbi:MAG: hypothetical protein MUD02_08060 [Bacteroidales bacterium]|jgi:hypothetical protein|nr:hypothetical protein [Bacteroidales bacterium]
MAHTPEYRRILSLMGFYDYQSRLIYRHAGQEGGWDSHTSNCRSFILDAVGRLSPGTVTVLGSGWLLELPVAEIIESVDRLFLVDIVHPPDLVAQAAAHEKITLVEQDVTGGLIREVYDKMKGYSVFRKRRDLSDISIPSYEPGFEPGLVISLNILTQMEALLVDYIRKRSSVSEDEFIIFRKAIQQNHLGFLSRHSSLLISDTQEVFTGSGGDTETVKTLLVPLPEGSIKEDWTWDFDLKGSDSYTRKSIMNVTAIVLG